MKILGEEAHKATIKKTKKKLASMTKAINEYYEKERNKEEEDKLLNDFVHSKSKLLYYEEDLEKQDKDIRKELELVAEAIDDWRKGELSDFSAWFIINYKLEEPSKGCIEWATKSILKQKEK